LVKIHVTSDARDCRIQSPTEPTRKILHRKPTEVKAPLDYN